MKRHKIIKSDAFPSLYAQYIFEERYIFEKIKKAQSEEIEDKSRLDFDRDYIYLFFILLIGTMLAILI